MDAKNKREVVTLFANSNLNQDVPAISVAHDREMLKKRLMCPRCGSKIQVSDMVCPSCSKPVNNGGEKIV